MTKLFLVLEDWVIDSFEINDTSTENINDIVESEGYVLEDIQEDGSVIWAIVSEEE